LLTTCSLFSSVREWFEPNHIHT